MNAADVRALILWVIGITLAVLIVLNYEPTPGHRHCNEYGCGPRHTHEPHEPDGSCYGNPRVHGCMVVGHHRSTNR